jgi:hypothetical protein
VKVRCFCGRYMAYTGRELAVSRASGGREEYGCRRCGARAVIWHAHGTDDWPVGGMMWDAAGRKVELDWNDDSLEWRPGGGAR